MKFATPSRSTNLIVSLVPLYELCDCLLNDFLKQVCVVRPRIFEILHHFNFNFFG